MPERIERESGGGLRELAPARLVIDPHSAQIGRHVRHYKVDRPSNDVRLQSFKHFRLAEVSANELDPRERLHLEDVEGDDPRTAGERASCDLGPSARRGSQIDDQPCVTEQMIACIDGFELERSP